MPRRWNVNENIMQEIVHELFSSLESLETQSAAILQFLKDKGLADEKELAPYLEQSGNASSVRWRGARVRIDHLISSAIAAAEREAKKELPKPREDGKESSSTGGQTSGTNEGEKEIQDTKQVISSQKSEGNDGRPSAEKNRNQPGRENENEVKNENERTSENAGEKAA
jgi:hypothetical protein